MKFKNSILNSMLAVALVSGVASAQEPEITADSDSSKLTDKLYFGASLGSSLAYTDIKQYPSGAPVLRYRSELGYGLNGNVGYEFNSVVALEGDLSWSRLNGTDRQMGRWFTASVLQWDLTGRFNLTNLISEKTIETRKFDVYALAGLGISAFRTSVHSFGLGVSTDPVVAVQGYEKPVTNPEDLDKKRKTFEGSGMIGLGLAYRATPKLDVTLDFKGYVLNSDKLDATLSINPTRDAYVFSAVGVRYHLGKSLARTVDVESTVNRLNEIMDKFTDTDGDGVADYLDKEINTAKGAKVTTDGVALDTDGDGVADHLDVEKLSPCKDVDAQGKVKDTDGDGVADCNDKEPNSAKGAQVDANGKKIVSEGGSGGSGATGATGATGAAGSTSAGLSSVFFDLNSITVTYKNYSALTQVAQYLKSNPKAKLVLVGNTDKVGNADYNKKLSQKRAEAIIDKLVKNYGVDKSRLSIVAKGSDDPISTKNNSEQNRRVDFMITK